MCRKLLSVVLLLITILNFPAAYAQRSVVVRNPNYNHYNRRYIRPYSNSYKKKYYQNGENYSQNFIDWSTPEEYTLQRNYIADSKLERLQRLERHIFGAVQQGSFDERYQRVREAVALTPPKLVKKTVLRRIGDYFSGQLTGFEPTVSEDFLYEPSYSQGFGNTSSYTYGTSPWNHGYNVNTHGIGNSSGIRILD